MLDSKAPSWTRTVLLAAAAYHIAWGLWVVLYPHVLVRWLGVPSPLYIEIWQRVAIMEAAYGAGYAIAAMNPQRHWPIVLLGLIAKVLAAAGFLHAAAVGHVSWRAGWIIAANDVLWWAPFVAVLRFVYAAHVSRLRACSPEVLSFAVRARTGTGQSIEQLSRVCPVLLVFLRHLGCTFCHEALADLSEQRRRIENTGARIVLIHMGDEEAGRRLFAKYRLNDVPQISDPEGKLYRAFGLPRGTLRMLFGPKVWWRGFEAGLLHKHGVGRLMGDGFQMPGLFLVFHGHVIRCFRHQSAADRPDYAAFVRQPEATGALS